MADEIENRKALLGEFGGSLAASDLASKTVNEHLSNVDSCINGCLLHEEALDMEEGCRLIDDFLGCYFIEKLLSES